MLSSALTNTQQKQIKRENIKRTLQAEDCLKNEYGFTKVTYYIKVVFHHWNLRAQTFEGVPTAGTPLYDLFQGCLMWREKVVFI